MSEYKPELPYIKKYLITNTLVQNKAQEILLNEVIYWCKVSGSYTQTDKGTAEKYNFNMRSIEYAKSYFKKQGIIKEIESFRTKEGKLRKTFVLGKTYYNLVKEVDTTLPLTYNHKLQVNKIFIDQDYINSIQAMQQKILIDECFPMTFKDELTNYQFEELLLYMNVVAAYHRKTSNQEYHLLKRVAYVKEAIDYHEVSLVWFLIRSLQALFDEEAYENNFDIIMGYDSNTRSILEFSNTSIFHGYMYKLYDTILNWFVIGICNYYQNKGYSKNDTHREMNVVIRNLTTEIKNNNYLKEYVPLLAELIETTKVDINY